MASSVKDQTRPHENWGRFRGYPRMRLVSRSAWGPACENPICDEIPRDIHHAWTRKQLAGVFDYVEDTEPVEPQFRVIRNIYTVCRGCHNALHGVGRHKSRLWWDELVGEMRWHSRYDGVWHDEGLVA